MEGYIEKLDIPAEVPDEAVPEAAQELTIDITESANNQRLLPERLYRERCRPIAIGEITYEMLHIFLEELKKTGLWETSANRVGLNSRILKRLAKMDERFRIMCDDANEAYVNSIEGEIHRRAFEGYDEPQFSHKTGGQLGVIRKYSDRLAEITIKRHRKEYRDNYDAPLTTQVSVMVVPMAPANQQDWIDMARQAAKPVASTPVEPTEPLPELPAS